MALSGKSAIVTGGNSGIGKAIVPGLAEAGAGVTINYVAHPEESDSLVRQIAADGGAPFGCASG